jgi:hypothetical protein
LSLPQRSNGRHLWHCGHSKQLFLQELVLIAVEEDTRFGWVWGIKCCEFCVRASTCRDLRRRLVGEAGLQIRCCQRPMHRSSRPSSWLRWHRRR